MTANALLTRRTASFLDIDRALSNKPNSKNDLPG
jgi:hypothetical protein